MQYLRVFNINLIVTSHIFCICMYYAQAVFRLSRIVKGSRGRRLSRLSFDDVTNSNSSGPFSKSGDIQECFEEKESKETCAVTTDPFDTCESICED